MSESVHVARYMCLTKDIGVGGNLFGGVMLAWMDESAAVYAHQQTGAPRMVTLKYEEILFKEPVHVGDIVEFFASQPRRGRTSFSFDLEARVHGKPVFHTRAIFVAVNAAGRPEPLPEA